MSVAAASQRATPTAIDHLHELWQRCLYCVALLIVGGAAGYVFRQQIITFLQRPLHEKLYYTSPMDSFNFIMQLCLLVGFILALPVICYNVLRFVEPALPKQLTKRTIFGVLAISYVLAIGGAAFGYYMVLPATLHFFGTIGGHNLQALITVNQYFSFVLSHLGLFAAVFQMPLLLLFANHITPFGPGSLRKARKYVFVGSFAISLVIPMSPDPLSQASLALPVIILFEVSEFLIWLTNRKRRRAAMRQEPVQAGPSKADVSRTPTVKVLGAPAVSANQTMAAPRRLATASAAASRTQTVDIFAPAPAGRRGSLQRRNFQRPVGRVPAQTVQSPPTPQPRLISDVLT